MEYFEITEQYVTAAAEAEAASLDTHWSAAQICEAMDRDDTMYLVAVDGGVLCAVASCVFSAYEAMVENVAVCPEYRKQGVASTMLSLIIGEAKKRGLESVSLEAASRNTAAIALYEKAGFLKLGVRKGFYRKQNDDAIVMVKEILDK